MGNEVWAAGNRTWGSMLEQTNGAAASCLHYTYIVLDCFLVYSMMCV